MIRPVDYNSEKIKVIENWQKRVILPMSKSEKVNRGYLVAATCICELCIKDIIEQCLGLFIAPNVDAENNNYLQLLNLHDTVFLNKQLKDITRGEYEFPILCDEIDARNMERVLYEEMNLDLDKSKIQASVDAYIKRHDELLEDYEQRRYRLKLSLCD